MSPYTRIVLLDSWGAELFSGNSVLSEAPPPPTVRRIEAVLATSREEEKHDTEEHEEEPVPETLRSSVFIRVQEPVSRPIIIEDDDHRAA